MPITSNPPWGDRPPPDPREREWAQENHDKLLAWIQQKAGTDFKCVVCGHSEWSIGEITEIPLLHESISPAVQIYPAMPVSCEHCAHLILFNAPMAGIEPPWKDPGRPARPLLQTRPEDFEAEAGS